MRTPIQRLDLRIARWARGLRQSDIEILSFGKVKQYRLSEIERGIPPTLEEAAAIKSILWINIVDGREVEAEKQE